MQKEKIFMLKRLGALLIVFITIFSLVGCATSGYEMSVYSDGRMLESFYVTLNQNAIELAGYDYLEVQNQVFSKFEEVRNILTTSFREADNGLTILAKEAFITQQIRTPSIENKTIGVSFLFNNYANYKLFYGIVDSEEDEAPDNKVVENKLFFIKTTTTTKTVFNNKQNSSIATDLLAYFSDPLNGNIAYDFSDVNFTYSYATNSSKLRSNADRVYYTNSGLKVHKWDVPSNNYDFEIEFYQYQIISTWWYVLALVLTALFTLLLIVKHNYNVYENKKDEIKKIQIKKVISEE